MLILLDAGRVCSATVLASVGRMTEKTAPYTNPLWCSLRITDRDCLSTMFLHTHKPSPVPASFFVVKNGSNKRVRISVAIPGPSSPTVRRTPSHQAMRSAKRPAS